MKRYTEIEVRAEIAKAAAKSSYRRLADAIGIKFTSLHQMAKGSRALTPHVIGALGFRKLPDAYVKER